ncbi:Pimeloyl-ACP methyl ester carboxylesterase [Marinospirillum celere]|uniref:Pimeloyl-ACP methyl ester carboxylesterase n=1 Tax=Marinospirillum celere TaxID=1122252 RepID=A0A1I1H204_9GAMM|nr:alpha/beta fold hydrolase [Marinospirillum celere]SFC18179.1 Pimeloyl-ACP methyl ester carboxylesterase [Marinospirillum celere]
MRQAIKPLILTGSKLKSSVPQETELLNHLVKAVAKGEVAYEQLINQLLPVLQAHHQLPTEAALQLSTALIEIEEAALAEDRLHALVSQQITPALAINDAGQVLTVNQQASQLLQLEIGDGLAALGVSKKDFQAFRQRLSREPGPTLIKVHTPASLHQKQPLILIGNYHADYQAYLLVGLQHQWPASIDLALQELFNLTASEREILAGLARGLSSEQLAQERQRSLGTVRQQVKSLLNKMGAKSQLQVATLAAAATNASRQQQGLSYQQPSSETHYPFRIGELTRNGRKLGWRRFGDPKGKKVILLHGPSFGAGDYLIERQLASEQGLDVYALERAGYGRSHPPAKDEDPLECQVQDLLAFMTQQQLNQVLILAHEVALIPALAVASRYPERVRGILGISCAPPFRELEQIQVMPDHQGIFIQAARHAPWVARLMTRLLLVRARQLGPNHWTDVIFQGLEAEQEVLRSPQHQSGIISTYSFYLNQMGVGFEVDLQVMLKDWSPLLQKLTCPLQLIHGELNATTPAANLSLFTEIQPQTQIDQIEKAGLTLALSHAELIYQRARAMA